MKKAFYSLLALFLFGLLSGCGKGMSGNYVPFAGAPMHISFNRNGTYTWSDNTGPGGSHSGSYAVEGTTIQLSPHDPATGKPFTAKSNEEKMFMGVMMQGFTGTVSQDRKQIVLMGLAFNKE